MRLIVLAFICVAIPAFAQPGRSAYLKTWDEMLHRAAGNHSPTQEEIAAAGALAEQPTPEAVAEALPSIHKALTNSDVAVRAYALTALTGLELSPVAGDQPAASSAGSNPLRPSTEAQSPKSEPAPLNPRFTPAMVKVLTPLVSDLGKELADATETNRILAAGVLGALAPSPPAMVLAPLTGYLNRDDGIGPAATAVVDDLLSFTPVSDETASALIRYLRRPDQTADSRSSLIDSIASHLNQNQAVNKALLAYFDTDVPSVRARLILSLPQLDLAPEDFTAMHARVANLAANSQENLQIVNAAKAVSACWTTPQMPSGCPAY